MPKGRTKTSAQVKRSKTAKPVGLGKPPKRPRSLSPEAKRVWTRVLKMAPWIDESNGLLLELFCEAFARWAEAKEQIREHGYLIESVNHSLCLSPWVKLLEKSHDQCVRLGKQLGMTMELKPNIQDESEKEDDFLAELDAPLKLASGG